MRHYLYKIKANIFFRTIMHLCMTITAAILPYIFKVFFDSNNNSFDFFVYCVIAYVLCIILNLAFSYIHEILNWKASITVDTEMKKDYFSSIVKSNHTNYKEKDVGEYISILEKDIPELRTDYIDSTSLIIYSVIDLLIYGIILFKFIDWRIATCIFISSIVALFIPKLTAKKYAYKRSKYLEANARYVSKFKEFLEGKKSITGRTYNNFKQEHEEQLTDNAKTRFKFGKFKVFTLNINGGSLYIINIAAFAAIAYLYINNSITIGIAIATIGYIESFISPIQDLLYSISTLSSLKEAKKRIFDIIGYKDTFKDKRIVNNFNNKIHLNNVTVKFDSFSLEDCNYEFKKGKKYAIIGENGSGKSTILNAIMKYTNAHNNIYIDDNHIDDIDTSNIIYCIDQNDFIFKDSFINNVSLYGTFSTDKLNDIINSFEISRDLLSVNDCSILSGGEKQLISFIRAILAETPIILLDEPFASVDKEKTDVLLRKLLSLNKTIIMVTHEIDNSLSLFDEIITVKNGKIIKSGDYNKVYSI